MADDEAREDDQQDFSVHETTVPVDTIYDESKRSCWVCFSTDEDEKGIPWVKPCNCRGTTKWVHQPCLQRWVDEKQKGNPLSKVSCPQCNTEYIIVFPHMGPLVICMDLMDSVVYKVCPFLAAGLLACSIYWSAMSYGALTVLQVFGFEEGMKVMRNAQVMVLVVGLPSIPLALIFGKTVRWEETVLTFLRRYSPKIPVLKRLFPTLIYNQQPEQRRNNPVPTLADTISATKVLCGALILPTVASVLGGVIFESIPSKVQRTILGGITFLAVKGLLRIYHKQQKYIQKNERIILDYTPENLRNPLNQQRHRQSAYTQTPVFP